MLELVHASVDFVSGEMASHSSQQLLKSEQIDLYRDPMIQHNTIDLKRII